MPGPGRGKIWGRGGAPGLGLSLSRTVERGLEKENRYSKNIELPVPGAVRKL